jgi:uncharacterized coiled-coil DUF342 family protein
MNDDALRAELSEAKRKLVELSRDNEQLRTERDKLVAALRDLLPEITAADLDEMRGNVGSLGNLIKGLETDWEATAHGR